MVVNVFRRPEQIKRLLAAIAIIGGSIALLALAQDLLGNGKIYWMVATGHGEAYSGTFINHSHYGQFMNLSIGAALGLILVKVHETFTGKKVTPPVVFEYLSSPAAKLMWFLLAMIIIGAATIFVSLTRGGMVSMLIAAGFTTLVLSSRQSLKGRGWIMALMALGAFICVLYIGFDAVYDRLATLRNLQDAGSGRWQIVKDITTAWTKFPVFGTGLGTHEVVYPMFDRSTIAALAAHAENEYAQAAEETGLIGLTALVCFGIVVWVSYVRNIRSGSVPIRSAAYGLGFGLLAIMLHSLSDFGQHLPANAFLSAVCCALLLGLRKESLGLARAGKKNNPTAKIAETSQGSRGLRIAVLICVSTVWAWALLSANSARLAEAHWKKVLTVEQNLTDKDWQASDEEYIDLISNAAAAADYQPDNVKYRHWLNVYRWESISRISDPNTGEVIMSEQTMEFVRRIVDELHNARLLCPTYGPTYCVLGQLEKFTLDDPNGAEHIRKGFQLAPCDPTVCFVTGLLDAEEQQIDASFEKFSRAIELDGGFFKGVADVYIKHVSRPDLAVAIAGDNTSRLSYVANALAGMEEHKDIVEKAQARVIELLKEKCSGPDAPAWALASLANICRKEKDNEAAIAYYRRALALDYSQVYWRFALARLLADTDRIPEAIHEARICLRLRPEFKAAEKLIADLSVLPGAVDEKNPAP
ncbi:MAG: O-antigen ligase family protein [Planctomycetes bacterium]|nr:O-antigen ligase family protein [Planctomycetota bacterium]